MAIIPGRNPMALIAYYLGVFSFIPCFGLALGIPAVLFGILGLSAVNRNPDIQGKGHAVTGLALGIVTSILWFGLIGLLVVRGFFSGPLVRW